VAEHVGVDVNVRYTGEDLLRLQGDFELVRGELVEMVPPGFEHGGIALNVASVLRDFVRARQLGAVVVESGFYLERNPDTVSGPDVAFYPPDRIPSDRRKFADSPPLLAVEIVSPEDSSGEMEARVRDFLGAGVAEVWVVYPRTRTVHRFRAGWAEVLTSRDSVRSVTGLTGFECPVAEFFAD